MTSDPRTMDATSDPVAAALADEAVQVRLLAAARAFLSRRAQTMTGIQRSAEAEEIVHTARAEVWKCRREYDPSRDLVAWIIGFISNATRDHLRKNDRLPASPPPGAPQLEDLAIDLGRPVADTVANKDFVERLMTRLKPDERRLLELKYTEDLTFAEIAARIGGNTTETAVRVRHHRILGQLRQWGKWGENAGEGQS